MAYKSIVGTEDDETFFLKQVEILRRRAEYREVYKKELSKRQREWYERHKSESKNKKHKSESSNGV